MKALGFEEKSVGTQTLGSELGCVHVSLYDPPVDLETAQRWKLRGVWFRSLARGHSAAACRRV